MMDKNFHNFSADDAIKLVNSQAGKQLIALLKQQNPQQIQDALAQANSGDYSQAKETLSSILKNPQAKALLNQLGRESHE